MKDKHDLVRGWLTRATSDLVTASLILDSPGPYYAVAVRYDFEFWPDQETAAAALTLAEHVQHIIWDALPVTCHPE